MDTTGSTWELAPKSIRRQFFQWAVKWFYVNVQENTSARPDIPSIVCLLQAIGFKLREFEQREHATPVEDPVNSEQIRVTMECGTSKMIAVLEMDEVKCECLDNGDPKDGTFWSISGTKPVGSLVNLNKIEETGSNLLPKMSKEVTSVVRDVVYRLLKIINNKPEIDQNTEAEFNMPVSSASTMIPKSTELKDGQQLTRSYTDFYDSNFKPCTAATFSSNLSSSNSKFNSTRCVQDASAKRPPLRRQRNFEIVENESIDEPRTSPPKIASSPVFEHLCTSLGQISLQSNEELVGLADYVVRAHQILDNAVNFIIKKLPINSSHSSIEEEGNFAKPSAPPLMSSSFCVSSPRSRGSSTNSLANRSISSGSWSRAGSASSGVASRPVGPPTAKKPVGRLPPPRDRSSSLGQVPSKSGLLPSEKSLTLAAANRRKRASSLANGAPSTSGLASTAVRSLTPTMSKLPGAVKVSGTACRNEKNLSAERTASAAKRNVSPGFKGRAPPSGNVQQQRANVSFIKAPTSASRLNASKFGFTASKK